MHGPLEKLVSTPCYSKVSWRRRLSINTYIYIKIVKQMRISSTITAIFLKRYLIYQHKVSESAFFSYKNMCAAVSRWRAENCCRAALRVLLGIHFSLSSVQFPRFRPKQRRACSTNNNKQQLPCGNLAFGREMIFQFRAIAICWKIGRRATNHLCAARNRPALRVLIIRSRSLNYCNLPIVPRRRRASPT